MNRSLGLALWAATLLAPLPAGASSLPFRAFQSFGTLQRIGPDGRGTIEVGIELAIGASTASESSLRISQFRDRLIESSNDLRPAAERRVEIDRLGPGEHGPRVEHRLRESRRSVTIELDGSRVKHAHQGIVGAGTSRRIPSEIADPLVVDSDFVSGYQLLIDHALARGEGIPSLDGVNHTAIVPSKLGTYDFNFELLGTESLAVDGGEQPFAKLRITRVEPPLASLPHQSSLDEKRLVWIAADGEIVRMDIPRQPRFQGESTTYNHRYRPDYFGARTDRIEIEGKPVLISTRQVRPTVDPASRSEARPAVLFVHDGSDASLGLVGSTLWNLTRRGLTVASLEVDPGRPDDLARAATVIDQLLARATVRKSRLFLITSGGVLPRSAPWDLSMFAAWAIVNGEAADRDALDASLRAAELPLLLLWGDEGRGFHARRDFAEATRSVVGKRASPVPLAQIDASMRYVPGVPSAAPKDDFGLAFGYVRGLGRWLEGMLE